MKEPCFGLLCKILTWTLSIKIHLNVELFNNCFFETLSETLGFTLFIAWVVKGFSTHGNIGESILENMGIMRLQNWYVYLVKQIFAWLKKRWCRVYKKRIGYNLHLPWQTFKSTKIWQMCNVTPTYDLHYGV